MAEQHPHPIKTTHLDGDMSLGRNLAIGGDQVVQGNATIMHNLRVEGIFDAPNFRTDNSMYKGTFETLEALRNGFADGEIKDGWYARVGVNPPYSLFIAENGEWTELALGKDIREHVVTESVSLVDSEGNILAEISGNESRLNNLKVDDSDKTITQHLSDIDDKIKKISGSVGKIDGQTITIGENSLNVVSDVQIEGNSAVTDGKANITYVADLDSMSEKDIRAAKAAAVKAKFDTVNKALEAKFDIMFVDELPTSGMSKYTIYIMLDKETKTYSQYIWKDGGWVTIANGKSYDHIPLASRTNDGLMSSGHFTKLEDITNIESGDINDLFNN